MLNEATQPPTKSGVDDIVAENFATPMVAVNFTVITPPGVDSTIYPWGPHSVATYVDRYVPGATGRMLDLRSVVSASNVVARHRLTLKRALALLSPEASGVCFGHALNPYIFLGLIAAAGPELLEITARENLLSLTGWLTRLHPTKDHRFTEALAALQADYEAAVDGALTEHIYNQMAPRRVIGISVYDYTLVAALHIARLIRRRDPDAFIVLGGDYLDAKSAEVLVAAIRTGANIPVNGIVVGYGEAVCHDLVAAIVADADTGKLKIPGLLRATDGDGVVRIVTPEEYGRTRPSVDYVRTDADAVIRVLSQRGCSWGNCSFCSQLDRQRFYPIDPASLRSSLVAACRAQEAIESIDGSRPFGRISFDADENDLQVVIPLMEAVAHDRLNTKGAGNEVANKRYLLEFWLMVRSFRADFLQSITGVRGRVLNRVRLNVESLGPDVLTAMRKGFPPLHALEAVKALRDAGQVVETNYFVGYPNQRFDDVAAEAVLLERALHLFTPPQVALYAFPYAANGRDDIAAAQERFHVQVDRIPEDRWVRALFGVNLPFSIWAHSYRRTGPLNLGEVLARMHHRLTIAQGQRRRAEGAWLVVGGPSSTLPRGALVGHRLAEAVAFAALWLAERFAGMRAYSRRQTLIDRLNTLRFASSCSDGARPATRDLRIEGNKLVRTDDGGTRTETPLDDAELAVLRFLYWTRRERDLAPAFPQLSLELLSTIIERHEATGSVIRHRQSLLCVAHDPGFALTGALESAPHRLRLDLTRKGRDMTDKPTVEPVPQFIHDSTL